MAKALIIGVDSYPTRTYKTYGGLDALAFSNALLTLRGKTFTRDNTRVLINERATSSAIMERLKWLKDVKSPDFYVLYFSGAGTIFNGRATEGSVRAESICALAGQDFSFADESTQVLLDYILSPVEFQGNGVIILDCLFEYLGNYIGSDSAMLLSGDNMLDSMRAKVLLPPGDILFRRNYDSRQSTLKLNIPVRKVVFYPGGTDPKLGASGLSNMSSGSIFTEALINSWKASPTATYLSLYKNLSQSLQDTGSAQFTPRMLAGSNFDLSKGFCTK